MAPKKDNREKTSREARAAKLEEEEAASASERSVSDEGTKKRRRSAVAENAATEDETDEVEEKKSKSTRNGAGSSKKRGGGGGGGGGTGASAAKKAKTGWTLASGSAQAPDKPNVPTIVVKLHSTHSVSFTPSQKKAEDADAKDSLVTANVQVPVYRQQTQQPVDLTGGTLYVSAESEEDMCGAAYSQPSEFDTRAECRSYFGPYTTAVILAGEDNAVKGTVQLIRLDHLGTLVKPAYKIPPRNPVVATSKHITAFVEAVREVETTSAVRAEFDEFIARHMHPINFASVAAKFLNDPARREPLLAELTLEKHACAAGPKAVAAWAKDVKDKQTREALLAALKPKTPAAAPASASASASSSAAASASASKQVEPDAMMAQLAQMQAQIAMLTSQQQPKKKTAEAHKPSAEGAKTPTPLKTPTPTPMPAAPLTDKVKTAPVPAAVSTSSSSSSSSSSTSSAAEEPATPQSRAPESSSDMSGTQDAWSF
jgi:hypothetical protein